VVELSLSTAFVTHWFIPRLTEFHEAFPTIDLRFQLISGTLRGAPGNVDLAMRMGTGESEDYHGWPFAPELVVPVSSPAYLRAHGTLEEPVGELGHVLLHFSDPLLDWELFWGGALNRRMPGKTWPDKTWPEKTWPEKTWIEFSDYAVVLQAAMNGEGIAPGWVSAASRALAEGKLVPASTRRVRTGKSYHLVASRARPLRDVVLAIRDWMIAEMRHDMEKIAPLLR
jgi:LysR family transcriptional regulator, glycine cleavage system transcriptional activator